MATKRDVGDDVEEMAESVERSEAPNNSARPNDIPIHEYDPVMPNSTLASRAKKTQGKKVDSAENKAVTSAQTKTSRR